MRGEDRQTALNPKQFRRPGSDKIIDISTLDESDPDIYETVFYKEVPVVNGNMDETLIVTYSPKYKAYQKRIRGQQISRAVIMIEQPGRKRRSQNQNDPARFIKSTAITETGEVAGKNIYDLLVYRLLEKKIGNKYTCNEILHTLRSMQVTLLSKESGYIPSYKRTALTDDLHKAFGFLPKRKQLQPSLLLGL
ncbi:MAG: hypothetical protein HFH14_02360 [Lachnospiraceae bacterium]|nr:hypothetical protein [Lachnospiraceae bacterium]